jgi:hypothetical protein
MNFDLIGNFLKINHPHKKNSVLQQKIVIPNSAMTHQLQAPPNDPKT